MKQLTQHLAPRPVTPVADHGQTISAVPGGGLRLVFPIQITQLQVARQGGDVGNFVLVSSGFDKEDFPVWILG